VNVKLWTGVCAGVAFASGAAQGQVALTLSRITGTSTSSAITNIFQAPGDNRRLYYTTQTGDLKVIRDGVVQAVPALHVVASGGENGLLGAALHPQYSTNHFLYLYYGVSAGPLTLYRYTLDPANPELIDPASATPVIELPGGAQHVGGWIGFGPDGYLYLSSGDRTNSANAQSLTTLAGKLVRIDVDQDDFPQNATLNYAVPPTNPFVGSTTALPEIWAYGLRNPWRNSFDRLTGDLWIGDVGAGSREELNVQPSLGPPPYAAVNYGWPLTEGTSNIGAAPAGAAFPWYEYDHTLGQAVVGGVMYRGRAIPALRGTYIFGDLRGMVWAFRPTTEGIVEWRQLFTITPNGQPGSYVLDSFGEDNDGELYIGSVYGVDRILPACAANCDGSTTAPVLNVLDFNCFLNAFTAGDLYANCDGSTTAPVLNVLDFNCFINLFGGGCP
jgi:glucose/arabinose dehydrogenase